MSHPDEDPYPLGTSRRRPSHFRRKKPRDATTSVVRVRPEAERSSPPTGRVVQRHGTRHEDWSDVINQAPALPDPVLRRPIPPPAPLPSESPGHDSLVPGWVDDRHHRKGMEDIIGTVGLAILVAAMLTAMWLQMRIP